MASAIAVGQTFVSAARRREQTPPVPAWTLCFVQRGGNIRSGTDDVKSNCATTKVAVIK